MAVIFHGVAELERADLGFLSTCSSAVCPPGREKCISILGICFPLLVAIFRFGIDTRNDRKLWVKPHGVNTTSLSHRTGFLEKCCHSLWFSDGLSQLIKDLTFRILGLWQLYQASCHPREWEQMYKCMWIWLDSWLGFEALKLEGFWMKNPVEEPDFQQSNQERSHPPP